MPIYEYKCKACGNKFERLRPISGRDNPGNCPDCESEDVTRLVSCVGKPKVEGNIASSSSGSSCNGCSSGTCSTCGI